MNFVAQQDSMGCGVACVANLLHITYVEALKYFDNPEYAKTIGYKCKYIVSAVRKSGLDVRLHHIKVGDRDNIMKGMKPVPEGAIIFLERSELYPLQHYLLKSENGWVDPWINIHENEDVSSARAGIRIDLPSRPYYLIY